MEEKLVSILLENRMIITTVESCTGGLIASKIVNVSGASNVLKEGFITYANSAKETYAGVLKDTLDKYGAVSKEVALEMAQGVAEKTGADVAISVTGIAGPDGGTKEKPVGLVYIGCAYKDEVTAREFRFDGDRYEIRRQAVDEAISMAVEMLENQ